MLKGMGVSKGRGMDSGEPCHQVWVCCWCIVVVSVLKSI